MTVSARILKLFPRVSDRPLSLTKKQQYETKWPGPGTCVCHMNCLLFLEENKAVDARVAPQLICLLAAKISRTRDTMQSSHSTPRPQSSLSQTSFLPLASPPTSQPAARDAHVKVTRKQEPVISHANVFCSPVIHQLGDDLSPRI